MLNVYTDGSCTEKVGSYADLDYEKLKWYPIDEYEDPIKGASFDNEGEPIAAVLWVHGGQMDGEKFFLPQSCLDTSGAESLEYSIQDVWYRSPLEF